MAITGKMLLEVPFCRGKLLLRGGRSGLDRRIKWFNSVESMESLRILQPYEMAFITGVSIGGNEEKLVELMQAAEHRHSSGLVLHTGRYLKEVPAALIAAADQLGMPLFEVPWDVKLGEITQRLGESIMADRVRSKNLSGLVKKIIFSEGRAADPALDTALFYDANLEERKQVIILQIQGFQPWDNEPAKERLGILFQEILAQYSEPNFCVWNGNEIIFLLSELKGERQRLPQALLDSLSGHFGLQAFGGIGGVRTDFAELPQSHQEASFALRMAKMKNTPFVAYEKATLFQILAHVKERDFLLRYRDRVLGGLLRYDEENGSNLVETLRIYLEENEDTMATSQRLFIHRNTLRHRLSRIREITGCGMENAEERLNFSVAFKLQEYMEFLSVN